MTATTALPVPNVRSTSLVNILPNWARRIIPLEKVMLGSKYMICNLPLSTQIIDSRPTITYYAYYIILYYTEVNESNIICEIPPQSQSEKTI